MKCIKAIKATKYSAIGDIKRLTEIEADDKVSTGYWKFVPKMEWKQSIRNKKVESLTTENVEVAIEPIKSNNNKKTKK